MNTKELMKACPLLNFGAKMLDILNIEEKSSQNNQNQDNSRVIDEEEAVNLGTITSKDAPKRINSKFSIDQSKVENMSIESRLNSQQVADPRSRAVSLPAQSRPGATARGIGTYKQSVQKDGSQGDISHDQNDIPMTNHKLYHQLFTQV